MTMLHEDVTKIPTDTRDFWRMVDENFLAAKQIFAFPLQSREEALQSEPYDAFFPSFIPYRGASSENDQRDYFYNLGNGQIDRLEVLISERQLTPEFAQAWGVLMCSYGHTLNYLMDDSRVLVAERGAASSANKRSLMAQRVWLAHVMGADAKGWSKRDTAEEHAVALIEKVIALGGIGTFGPEWFSLMLSRKKGADGKAQLKSTFQQNKFSVREMEFARANGVEDIPPIDETSLLSGKR